MDSFTVLINMNKRLFILGVLGAALAFIAAPASAQPQDFTFSAGVAGGDYRNVFSAGISYGQLVSPFLQAEAEVFYYRQPSEPSHITGLAITSTAINFNASILLQPDPTRRVVTPYAALTGGVMYESETWEWDLEQLFERHSYTRWNVGLGAGIKVMLNSRSGLRLDFRWLRFLKEKTQIPRYSLGYILRF